jgi:hypothetical protein
MHKTYCRGVYFYFLLSRCAALYFYFLLPRRAGSFVYFFNFLFFWLPRTVASTLFAAALGLRVGLAANRRRCFVRRWFYFILLLLISLS